jgi:hypothetical protein
MKAVFRMKLIIVRIWEVLTTLLYEYFVSLELSRHKKTNIHQNYFSKRLESVNIFGVKEEELRIGYIFLRLIVIIDFFRFGLILSHFKWFSLS